jgi:hypothetical protein
MKHAASIIRKTKALSHTKGNISKSRCKYYYAGEVLSIGNIIDGRIDM